jgi:hypothetical protein
MLGWRPKTGGRSRKEDNPTASGLRPTASHKGEVFEDTDHYYLIGRNGERIVISSFQIEPKRRIIMEDGELIDADVTTDKGRVFHNMRFPREAWQSKRALLRFLGPVDLQWTGSDENLQGVLRLVASRSVPCKEGTRNLGYFESSAGPRWVTPDGVLGPTGDGVDDDPLIYVSSGASLERHTRYRPADDPMVEASAAATVLPNLLVMNAPEVMLPLIGWFFAAPLKPRIREALGHFPLMWV